MWGAITRKLRKRLHYAELVRKKPPPEDFVSLQGTKRRDLLFWVSSLVRQVRDDDGSTSPRDRAVHATTSHGAPSNNFIIFFSRS